jgi:hypothetical protein
VAVVFDMLPQTAKPITKSGRKIASDLLLRWHYSQMKIFASLMDFSHSALFVYLFPNSQ